MVDKRYGGIEIKNISQEFTNPAGESIIALDNISFDIEPGEFVSLIGPSGCGKTTLLRLIAGLAQTVHGHVSLDGQIIRGTSFERGFMFQDPELFLWMNIENNVAFGLKARRIYQKRKDDVQKYINLVGLKGFEKSYPHHLSGGMAQRASLARALINQPKVLLLDEPFGALDAFTRMAMQKELMKIWADYKMTMVMVTHDIDEAIFLSSKIVVMTPRPGRIKEIVINDLPRPRDRNQQEFSQLRQYIMDILEFLGVEEA